MALQAEDIGANFSSYTGSSALGGGVDIGVLNIDTKPIEDLGKYTMIYNKAAQEQKEKELQQQAAKLAELTSYDLTTAIPKDRELIQSEYDNLYNFAQKNPTVLDYKNNPKGYLEFGKMKNDFTNKLKGAKVRSIGFLTRQQDINNEPNAELKAIKQKQLDKDIADSDINTPLQITEKFDLTQTEIPVAQSKTFDVSVIGDDQNVKREYSLVDIKDAKAKSSAAVLGMLDKTLDEQSPEFISKTPEEQSLLRSQNAQRKAAKTFLPIEQANQFNAAIQQYMSTDEPGQVDIELIRAKNPMLFGVIQQYENYNNYVRTMADQIRAGVFKDKLGNTIQFGPNGLDESAYQPISYTDGITADEIVLLQSVAKAKPDGYKTTIQETDNKLQEDQLKQKTLNDKEQRNIDWAQLAQKKKEWQSQWDASEKQTNGAYTFATNMYKDLEKLSTNGLITPDNIRKLSADQLKYLGIEQPATPAIKDAQGNVITAAQPAGLKALDLGDQTVAGATSYVIELNNGKINVLKDAKPLGGRRYTGLLDNTKSTTIDAIATNRLKEEVKSASGKELNAFSGLDITKGNTETTSGKSGSSSGSANSNKGPVAIKYTKADEDGISRVLIANPGVTREQAIEALKKAGKLK